MRRRTPMWLRAARRLLPAKVWSGAGVITGKVHREAAEAAGGLVTSGRSGLSLVYGAVLPRWVLVVRDDDGIEHYVNVSFAEWDRHEVDDVISADDPLVDMDE